MIHPWQRDPWQRLVATRARPAHALLLSGARGQGKRNFAEAYAAHLLCSRPDEHGFACGTCAQCCLRLSGNHPDLLRIVPAADQAEPESAPGKTKPSTQIVIEQVRQLREQLAVTGHQSDTRVVIVDPAEAMNSNTANALLKLLEEPPEGTRFLLVSAMPRRLLPTIRSRCQHWPFPRPEPAAARAWLREHGGAGDDALLALSGNMPLAAAQLAQMDGARLRQRFISDLLSMPPRDAVMVAGDWDAWLRAKDTSAAGFTLVRLIEWMLRWVWDLSATRLGGQARYFPDCQTDFTRLAAPAGNAAMLDCYNALVQIHRAASHPLNVRLVLEDMLLRYARALAPSRSPR